MNSPLTYKENYWSDPASKSEFLRFLNKVHGLDLTLWDRMGFWDQSYRPLSYFKDSSLVSNVCVYSMDLMVQGKRCRAAQVSAVGTLPEFRKQGLSYDLTEKALSWAKRSHDCVFLFADTEAYSLYNKFGFHLVEEYKTRIKVSADTHKTSITKLDVNKPDHRTLIYKIASKREPVSNLLGVMNERLFMFWCLYFLQDNIYLIPELNVLALFKRENGVISVFDIVSKNTPEFSEIYPHICAENDTAVEFLFMTDKMNLENHESVKTDGNGTHVMSDFPLSGSKFIFPYTAQA